MDDRLEVPAEVRAWLNDLRISDPARARLAAEAVLALIGQGSGRALPRSGAVSMSLHNAPRSK